MSKSRYSVNWIAPAFFGIAAHFVAIAQPGQPPLAALNIIPFALALIASRSGTAKAAAWVAVGINGLWAVSLTLTAAIVTLGLDGAPAVIPMVLAISIPCWLNVHAFWRALRAKS